MRLGVLAGVATVVSILAVFGIEAAEREGWTAGHAGAARLVKQVFCMTSLPGLILLWGSGFRRDFKGTTRRQGIAAALFVVFVVLGVAVVAAFYR